MMLPPVVTVTLGQAPALDGASDRAEDGMDADRRELLKVASLPDGTRLRVVVGSPWVDPSTVALLRGHLDRLTVQVEGSSPAAVAAWFSALDRRSS